MSKQPADAEVAQRAVAAARIDVSCLAGYGLSIDFCCIEKDVGDSGIEYERGGCLMNRREVDVESNRYRMKAEQKHYIDSQRPIDHSPPGYRLDVPGYVVIIKDDS